MPPLFGDCGSLLVFGDRPRPAANWPWRVLRQDAPADSLSTELGQLAARRISETRRSALIGTLLSRDGRVAPWFAAGMSGAFGNDSPIPGRQMNSRSRLLHADIRAIRFSVFDILLRVLLSCPPKRGSLLVWVLPRSFWPRFVFRFPDHEDPSQDVRLFLYRTRSAADDELWPLVLLFESAHGGRRVRPLRLDHTVASDSVGAIARGADFIARMSRRETQVGNSEPERGAHILRQIARPPPGEDRTAGTARRNGCGSISIVRKVVPSRQLHL